MDRLSVFLCGLILAAIHSSSAWADTIYTYKGNPFTLTYGPYTNSDFVQWFLHRSFAIRREPGNKPGQLDSLQLQ